MLFDLWHLLSSLYFLVLCIFLHASLNKTNSLYVKTHLATANPRPVVLNGTGEIHYVVCSVNLMGICRLQCTPESRRNRGPIRAQNLIFALGPQVL